MQSPTDQESFKQPVLDQLRKPGGLALGFLGTMLSLVTVFVLPEWKIPAQWLIAVAIVGLSYAWISQSALSTLRTALRSSQDDFASALQATANLEPKIVQAMVSPDDEREIILLLQPNRLFGHSMIVSIYYEDERNFELLVASGRVSNVQSNGLIQITVTNWESSHDETRCSVIAENPQKLMRLLVRPAPTTEFGVTPEWKRVLQLLAAAERQESAHV